MQNKYELIRRKRHAFGRRQGIKGTTYHQFVVFHSHVDVLLSCGGGMCGVMRLMKRQRSKIVEIRVEISRKLDLPHPPTSKRYSYLSSFKYMSQGMRPNVPLPRKPPSPRPRRGRPIVETGQSPNEDPAKNGSERSRFEASGKLPKSIVETVGKTKNWTEGVRVRRKMTKDLVRKKDSRFLP